MSSTNRGGQRVENDFYSSPSWCTRAIVPHLPDVRDCRIIEPSAGRGGIVKALIECGADTTQMTIVELDHGRGDSLSRFMLGMGATHATGFDFMTWTNVGAPFDLAVMNPPYSDAEEHVTRAISLLAPGGICAALLRLPFITGSGRRAFRAAHPCDVYPLASRPSFTAEALEWMTDADLLAEAKPVKAKGDKPAHVETIDEVRTRLRGSDSVDYAWFLFPATRVPGVRYSSDMVLDGKA